MPSKKENAKKKREALLKLKLNTCTCPESAWGNYNESVPNENDKVLIILDTENSHISAEELVYLNTWDTSWLFVGKPMSHDSLMQTLSPIIYREFINLNVVSVDSDEKQASDKVIINLVIEKASRSEFNKIYIISRDNDFNNLQKRVRAITRNRSIYIRKLAKGLYPK